MGQNEMRQVELKFVKPVFEETLPMLNNPMDGRRHEGPSNLDYQPIVGWLL